MRILYLSFNLSICYLKWNSALPIFTKVLIDCNYKLAIGNNTTNI